MKIKRSPKVIAGAVAIGLIAAGGAFAYWTFNGAGGGSAQTAANPTQGIVVHQTGMTGLAPGESVALSGNLTNPNNTDIKVGTLTAVISVPPGVSAADFSLTGNPQVIEAVVTKGAPISWAGMTLVYANSAVSQDNAKNVPVTLTYTLTPGDTAMPPVVPPANTVSFTGAGGTRAIVISLSSFPLSSGATYTVKPGDVLWVQNTDPAFILANMAVGVVADSTGHINATIPVTVGYGYQVSVNWDNYGTQATDFDSLNAGTQHARFVA